MKINYRKYALITFFSVFAILTGLDIKAFLADTSVYKELVNAFFHFAMMCVIYYEWMIIIKKEKEVDK